MSTVEWYNSINQVTGTQVISNITEYTVEESLEDLSPIDRFYKSLRGLIQTGQQDLIDRYSALGPLLLVGAVSSTENYFRDVLTQVIRICPTAQECSSEQNINLGSVLWHGGLNAERGAFENTSFASPDGVLTNCRKFINFEVKNNSLISAVLTEYGKICELRHGIVHSNLILAGKNAIKLGLPRTERNVLIKVGFREFQESALICTTLVTSFNIELFKELARRWAVDWRRKIVIDHTNEEAIFDQIWRTMYSTIDAQDGNISFVQTKEQCIAEIKSQYRLA
jgi:hypothetical protein